jgi:ABC-type Fe3+ transport system permease subunit
VALLLAPRLATGLLARDVTPGRALRLGAMTIAGPLLLAGLVLVTLILPLAGFAQPLWRSFPVARVAQEVARTVGPTAVYGVIACGLATVLGVGLAVCAGRSATLRVVLLAGLVLVLSLPPSLGALGWITLAGASPSALDPLLRSPFTVGAALALRFFPIVTLLALRSLGTTSPSWAGAAALHGISLTAFAGRVLAPWLAPAIATASLLVVLLATADVVSVLLLHPPGKSSLPLAIFTVMANAPEALVGALCLAYVGGAAVVLGIGLLFWTSFPRQP